MSDEVVVSDNPDRIEKYIIRYIGKQSAREMAEALGVSPETILRTKREIVESIDPITIQVRQLKLLTQLHELADAAQEKIEHADTEFFAGIVNSSVGAIKTLLVEYNRATKGQEEAVTALNNLRARELLRLIDTAVHGTLVEIAQTHDLDEYELQQVFREHLKDAAGGFDAP